MATAAIIGLGRVVGSGERWVAGISKNSDASKSTTYECWTQHKYLVIRHIALKPGWNRPVRSPGKFSSFAAERAVESAVGGSGDHGQSVRRNGQQRQSNAAVQLESEGLVCWGVMTGIGRTPRTDSALSAVTVALSRSGTFR